MSSNLEKATKLLLDNAGVTCAVCNTSTIYTSCDRGVKPLLEWIENGTGLKHFSAADRIVGKAAAFLYVILEVDEVFAPVMSEEAINTLSRFGIAPHYNIAVKEIRNRDNTGCCPIEKAVADISKPTDAYNAICSVLKSIRNKSFVR